MSLNHDLRLHSLLYQGRVPAAVAFVALMLAACGSATVNVPTAGGKVAISGNGKSGTLKTPTGSVALGSGLPVGFPTGIPLPDRSKVQSGIATDQNGKQGWMVTLSAPGDAASVMTRYQHKLQAAGYKVLSSTVESSSTGGAGGQIAASSSKWQVMVIVASNKIELIVSPAKS